MNIVIDEKLQGDLDDFINPRMNVTYISCSLEDTEDCIEELVEKTYAECVDHRADLFVGGVSLTEELSKLGMKCMTIGWERLDA